MKRYGLYDDQAMVINVVIWDGESTWFLERDYKLIQHDQIDIGDYYDENLQSITKFYEFPSFMEG